MVPKDVVGRCCIPTTIFGSNAVSEAGLSGRQAHLCNNPGPNLELTVNGPDRRCDSAPRVRARQKKAAADAAAFHDPDKLAARARAATIAR
jgi:hypothetical protein